MNQSDKHDPSTVDKIAEDIIADLPLDARISTANLDEDEFRVLELTLGKYIRHKLEQGDDQAKRELLESCIEKSGKPLNEVDAAAVIIKRSLEKIE